MSSTRPSGFGQQRRFSGPISVGVHRDAILSLAPAGLVLVTLLMPGIQFNQRVKFVVPMVGFVLGFGAQMLAAQVMALRL